MKKLLSTLMILFAPSSAFGLIGFGIQGVNDLSKFETYTYSDGGVNINSYAMNLTFGLGGYGFIDLFGYALEAEVDVAAGEYEFDFGNEIMGTIARYHSDGLGFHMPSLSKKILWIYLFHFWLKLQ